MLRTALPGDHAGRPGAEREWWILRAFDLRGSASVELLVERDSSGSRLTIRRYDRSLRSQRDNVFDIPEPSATRRRLSAGGPGAGASVILRRGGATVNLDTTIARGRLRLVRAWRGPAALGFRLGPSQLNPAVLPPLTWNWAVPVARATVRGGLDAIEGRIGMDGWLAFYEHGWGEMAPGDTAYDHWESWLVHRGAATWVSHGLNREDTITGPGARDGQWLGLFARVTRRGVRVCRPTVHRRRWSSGRRGLANAHSLEARCRGLRATFSTGFQPFGFGARVGGRGQGWYWSEYTTD